MAEVLEVNVRSTNRKLGYSGVSRDNPPIAMDYTPPLGDGRGYMPLELLLISLANCSGGTLAYLLRKAGKQVSAVSVHAKGIRREQSPTSFRQIFLEFELHSSDVGEKEMETALRRAEESVCAVWAMVQGNVEIIPSYKIIPS